MVEPPRRPAIRSLSRAIVAAVLLAGFAPAAFPQTTTRSAERTPLVHDLAVPGGVAGLLRAARVPPAPPSLALLNLVRGLHGKRLTPADERKRLDAIATQLAALTPSGASAETVPLPLAPDVWTKTVFAGRAVTTSGLLSAIIQDRAASLLYYGLMSLDDATLAYFAGHPDLLPWIYGEAPGIFASFGRSLHIRGDRMVLPGGGPAEPFWEAVVGAPAANPERFVVAVLARDAGRRAYFLDALAHMDSAHQAFALGLAQGTRGLDQFRALYATVAGFEWFTWRLGEYPFVRRQADPAIILSQVAVTRDGRLAPPGGLSFWTAALEEDASACKGVARQDEALSASWLVARLLRQPARVRRLSLDAMLFAERVFAGAADGDLPAVCQAAASFPRYQALLLTLEHMGFSAPKDYVAAVEFADTLDQGSKRAFLVRLAQVQGALAILDRLATVSDARRPVAQDLARALFGRGTQVGAWMRTSLVPALCEGQPSVDACLEAAVSGGSPDPATLPVIDWEGQRYRVDVAGGLRNRLTSVRRKQGSTRLDDAMTLATIGLALGHGSMTAETAKAYAETLSAVSPRVDRIPSRLFGVDVPEIGPPLTRAAKALATRTKSESVANGLIEAADVALGRALASFAYAMAIGDADASMLLAGDPADAHDFGTGDVSRVPQYGPWRLPEELRSAVHGWLVQGSLLGLPRPCANTWQRRLSMEMPQTQPTLDEHDWRTFPYSSATFNPFRVHDESLAAIVEAVRKGTGAIQELVQDPVALFGAASEIGISEWRCRAATWTAAHDPAQAADLFSLAERLWLGQPALAGEALHAWGVPAGTADGSLHVRVPRGQAWEDVSGRGGGLMAAHLPDLHLRIAGWLAERKLPAVLAPGVASFAMWDMLTRARLVDIDDWFAVVRAAQTVPDDRLADDVSALTADGTLTPIK